MTKPSKVRELGGEEDIRNLPPPGPRSGSRQRANNNDPVDDSPPVQRRRIVLVSQSQKKHKERCPIFQCLLTGSGRVHDEQIEKFSSKISGINNGRGDKDGNILVVGIPVARTGAGSNATDREFRENLLATLNGRNN
jgi:hypothetical protein